MILIKLNSTNFLFISNNGKTLILILEKKDIKSFYNYFILFFCNFFLKNDQT